ncbi:MAG: hypothetical protein QXI91_04830 [Candidatus Bathyarchaeia archaeon]
MDSWNILIQLLPYSPGVILLVILLVVVKYWERIKRFMHDVKIFIMEIRDNFYLSIKVGPAVNRSLFMCKKCEPILQVYKNVIPLQLKVDKNTQDVQIKLERGKAIALIPSICMDNVVKAMDVHFRSNLSQFSIVRDYSKLERALELFCVELVLRKSGLNGALEIATRQFINSVRQDEDVRLMLDILVDVNSKLKQFEKSLDRRLLRILLIEICRAELNGIGKMFM